MSRRRESFAMEVAPLEEVREHLPETLLDRYEGAISFIEGVVLEAREYANDVNDIGQVAPLLDDLATAIRRIR